MRIEDVYITEHIKGYKNKPTDKSTVRRKKDMLRERILEMISSISKPLRD